jgi:hypothetical protein
MQEQTKPSSDIMIKMRKGGWEIQIVCNENQANKAISDVLEALRPRLNYEYRFFGTNSIEPVERTCHDLLLTLYKESWFSKERTSGETHEELARKGYHYHKSAVAHALLDLVVAGTLQRFGIPRQFSYIEKKNSDTFLPH